MCHGAGLSTDSKVAQMSENTVIFAKWNGALTSFGGWTFLGRIRDLRETRPLAVLYIYVLSMSEKITVIRRDSKTQFITIKPSSHTSAWPWNELTRFNRNQRRGPKSEGRKMHIGLWQSCFFTSFNQLISPCEYCVQACTQHSKCDLTTIEYKGRTLVIPEEILFAWILFAALLRLSGGLGVFWNC